MAAAWCGRRPRPPHQPVNGPGCGLASWAGALLPCSARTRSSTAAGCSEARAWPRGGPGRGWSRCSGGAAQCAALHGLEAEAEGRAAGLGRCSTALWLCDAWMRSATGRRRRVRALGVRCAESPPALACFPPRPTLTMQPPKMLLSLSKGTHVRVAEPERTPAAPERARSQPTPAAPRRCRCTTAACRTPPWASSGSCGARWPSSWPWYSRSCYRALQTQSSALKTVPWPRRSPAATCARRGCCRCRRCRCCRRRVAAAQPAAACRNA